MKEEIIAEILKYWNTFDTKEKIAHLQMYEKINAKLHNRLEREVVFVEPKKKGDLLTFGQYKKDEPALLRIAKVKIDKYDAIRMLDTTYHEGYHAFVHDFLDNINDLKTFSNLTKNEFFTEFKQNILMLLTMSCKYRDSKDKISQYFKDYYYEEQLVYKESLIFMLYNILKLSSNKSDIEILYKNFKILISQYFEHEKRISKPPILITKEDIERSKQMLNEVGELFRLNLVINLDDKNNKRLIKRFKTEQSPEVSAIKYDVIIELIENALNNLKYHKDDNKFLKFEFEKTAELINLK